MDFESSFFYYYIASLFFIFGAIFGSFANVLILRMPEEKSIVPRSQCNHCHQPIKWYHNIPLISWLWLRGKCASCGASFSIQYFIVELTMATLFSLAFVCFGWSWFLLEMLVFIFASVTASFIDLKHFILPDVFTIGGVFVGLIGAALNPERSFWDAVIGCFAGGGFLYLTAYVHYKIRGVEGMGGGDIKLVAWIGAVMGWPAIPFVFLVASISGGLVGVFLSLFFRRSLREPIPFGPFLTMAALVYAFLAEPTIVQSLFMVRTP